MERYEAMKGRGGWLVWDTNRREICSRVYETHVEAEREATWLNAERVKRQAPWERNPAPETITTASHPYGPNLRFPA